MCQNIQNPKFISHHYKSCTHLPGPVRAQIDQAKSQPGRKRQSKSNSKDYWSQSAREAGLVDDQGIFFAADADADGTDETEEQQEQGVVDDDDNDKAEVGAEHAGGDEEETEAVVPIVEAEAEAEAEPLPFDSIALFGPGLGLIDDDDGDNADAEERKVDDHRAEQEAAEAACTVHPSAPAPAPVLSVSHHSTTTTTVTCTSEADEAMLHEALAILSDDAEDEVASDDGTTGTTGTGTGFEPLPMKEEGLQSTYSTAMAVPPPPPQQQQTTTTAYPRCWDQEEDKFGNAFVTGSLTGGSDVPPPTSWYGSRGPSHTKDQHPLAYASGMFRTTGSSSSGASPYGQHQQHQHQQPRRHSTMGSSFLPTAEQQQMYQAQYRQPRRFSLAGTVSPHRNYYYNHRAAEDQQRQHPSSSSSAAAAASASAVVAPMIPFASPIDPSVGASSTYAQPPAPLAMPLPLPTAMAKRRSSVVSSASDGSGCSSPAIATPSTGRSSSYGVATGACAIEETMVFPAAAPIESNKRARYE